jgi:hypothetical protein
VRGVAERDQLAPAGQNDRIEKFLMPRHQGTVAVKRNAPSPTRNPTRTVSQVAKFK